MSDEAVPVVVADPAPKKLHWKTKAALEAKIAAQLAKDNPAPEAPPSLPLDVSFKGLEPEPATPVLPPGKFMTWSEFCNRVSVEAVTSPFWHTKLGHVKGENRAAVRASIAKEPGPFFNVIRKAYLVMSETYAKGMSEFGE
jgi:hypothetical protein